MQLSDFFRNVYRVAEEDPSGQTIILSGNEMSRIMNAARIQTVEEKRAALERLKQQKEEELVWIGFVVCLFVCFSCSGCYRIKS